ncbi:hypothetical protein OIU76_011083 [Salix suchowensis]|nr:hypothetical protein OIU76_011083 [Salix suchowensis]
MSGGWERLKGSRSRTTRDSSFHTPAPSRTVTLGRVQPQAPGHRTIYCNDREANLPVRFKGNSISTTKYNFLTFLPKGLFEQFRRVANCYFLLISILSMTPISPVNPVTNVVPLSLVLLVSLIKEAFEDWKRFQNDMVINNTLIDVLQNEKWVALPWKKLQVGDIIRPPCCCYADCAGTTANLDGETNLKIRKALERTWDYLTPDKATEFKGEMQCEQPNNSLYTFTGNLIFQKQTLPLSPNQILLRGCSLRNTEYIVGAVIFTGHETKVMMNSMNVPSKRSTLERKLDKLILALFATLFIMCLIGAIGSGIFINRKYYYLSLDKAVATEFNPGNRFAVAALTLFTLITLYSTIIPISLYVSIEVVQEVRKSSTAIHEKGFNFDDHRLMRGAWRNEPNFDACKEFFRCLAICHTVLPEGDESPEKITYQAASPDEAALVTAAKNFGFFFYRRTPTMIHVRESHVEKMGKIQDVAYEILNVLEFNSTRKRQSVVCRYPNGRLVLYCKGADTVIYERLAGGNDDLKKVTRAHLEQFGDREKKLDEVAELVERDLILIGSTAIEDKLQEGVPACIETLFRAGIKVWVLTGDKMETAINIAYGLWLINWTDFLYFSCNLINNDMKQFIISSETDAIREVEDRGDQVEIARFIREEVKKELKKCLEEAQHYLRTVSGPKLSLVIDGKCLMYALDPTLRVMLLNLSLNCHSVVCCRVSPLQKAQNMQGLWFYQILDFVKTNWPITFLDVSASLSKKYPELYKEGIRNVFFKWRVVITWAWSSVYQSLVFYHFVTISSAGGKNSSGKIFGLWDISTMAFTCVVITVNLRLLMMCNSITRWHYISVGGSILAWFLFIFVYSLLRENVFFVIFVLMSTIYFYLSALLVPVVALLGDFIYQGIQRCFFPYDYQIIQEIHRHEPDDNTRAGLLEVGSQLTPQEERSYALSQLPRELSKHTGFAFDSPGYESFFAAQLGVYAPQKAWDVARRASMKSKPKTPKRN